MDNWNAILEPYGIMYSNDIGTIIQNAGSLLFLSWEMKEDLPYCFIYREIVNRYQSLTESHVYALIAAGRLLQLSDDYIVQPELVTEAKCVMNAYYQVISKQVKTNQALGGLWLDDSRQELLGPYGICLLPEIREALTYAEGAICTAEYGKIYRTLNQKFESLTKPVLTVLMAAARLGKLDERYVRDERHFFEARAVLNALVEHIRSCLADEKCE